MTHVSTNQQGDVLLFQTDDGGEIVVDAGIMEMSGGLDTAVYLSLFGGNEDDDGGANNSLSWWGNIDVTIPEEKQVSRTQHLLQALPAVTANIVRIQDAVARDLQWLLDVRAASEIAVVVALPSINRVSIAVTIVARGSESSFTFTENWKATQ